MKKKIIESYYDGHYVDSGYSQEEREKLLQESLENDKKFMKMVIGISEQ